MYFPKIRTNQFYLWTSDSTKYDPITELFLVDEDEAETILESSNEEGLHIQSCGTFQRSVQVVPMESRKSMVLLKQRGKGCPVTQLSVFRSPKILPKYKYSECISLVKPGKISQSCIDQDSEHSFSHRWKCQHVGGTKFKSNYGSVKHVPIGKSLFLTPMPLPVDTEKPVIVNGTFTGSNQNEGFLRGVLYPTSATSWQFLGECKRQQKKEYFPVNFTVENRNASCIILLVLLPVEMKPTISKLFQKFRVQN